MSIIGLDIDGVLSDFVSSYTDLFIATTGVDNFHDRHAATFPPCFDYPQLSYGYTDDHAAAVWKLIKKDMQFWMKLEPLVGTQETLEKLDSLRLDGHDIYFVTSRPGLMAKWQTETWLQTHGFDVPTVIMHSDKGAVVKLLEMDAYIDDHLVNANEVMRVVREEGMMTRVYLKDAPYNDRPVGDPDGAPVELVAGAARDPGLKVVADAYGMLEEEGLA